MKIELKKVAEVKKMGTHTREPYVVKCDIEKENLFQYNFNGSCMPDPD